MKRLVFALVAMLGLIGCQTADIDADRMVKFFNTIAFSKYSNYKINKWDDTILVKLVGKDGENPEKYRQEVEAQFRRISEITEVSVEVLADGDTGYHNYTIEFIPTEIVEYSKGYWCDAKNWCSECSGYRIYKARLRIGTRTAVWEIRSPEWRVKYCIAHETMHSLGLGGHPFVSGSVPSVLAKDSSLNALKRDLTHWDELALRALYDPRLEPGMTRGEAEPIIQKIMSELLGGGRPSGSLP